MELATIRKLVVAVIVLLLTYQVGVLIGGIFNSIWGVISAIVVAGVTFVSSRQARVGVGNTGWFLVPTLLFTVLPFVVNIWKFFTSDSNLWKRIIDFTPFLVGFALPIGILLVVYDELRKQTQSR
jgi:hypothetical protein